MAIRQQRDEKAQPQVIQSGQMYVWKGGSTPQSEKKVASPLLNNSRMLSPEDAQKWLKKDLRLTVIALLVIAILFAAFVWRILF